MRRSEEFVRQCKVFIENDSLDQLQNFITEYSGDDGLAWEFILQKLYLHACLKKKKYIADAILDYRRYLDPIQQIGIRQMIAYGNWLLARPLPSTGSQ